MTVVTYALTTRAKVKEYLGISVTDYDAVIDALVNSATSIIESFCGGRRFLSSTYANEIYDSAGGRCIFLNNRPISSLTSVQYRSGTVTNPNWVEYSADGYLLYGDEGFVKFYAKLPEISQGLRFSYVAGYLIDWANEGTATHTLPFDLTQVCTEIVAKKYNKRNADGIKTMSTEGQSITFETDGISITSLSEEHKSILARYQGTVMAI